METKVKKDKKPKVEKVVNVKLEKVEKVKKEKKFFSMDEKRYGEIKSFLLQRGDEYEVVNSGVSEKIIHNGRYLVPIDKTLMSGSGFHLSNIVKNDIKKYLENNSHNLIKRERDYLEQRFNLDAIEKNIGNLMISIDINDCYWQTAFNMGYISEKTYLGGKVNPKWKVGRNASIGSLAKTEVITTYKNGEIARDIYGKVKKRIVEPEKNLQHIRHNIVGFVCDMFMDLVDYLGSDFCMYLTDCVFTTIENKSKVEEFFKAYGYSCKNKTFEFTGVDRKEKTIEWVELRDSYTIKYYRYSDKQIINFNR